MRPGPARCQAELRATRACGIVNGGFAPLGWLTEGGPAPWLGTEYGLVECETPGYPARTRANVEHSDATIWLGSTGSSCYKATAKACADLGKPMLVIEPGETTPSDAIAWLDDVIEQGIVNVAGDRESASPGIGERSERWLTACSGGSTRAAEAAYPRGRKRRFGRAARSPSHKRLTDIPRSG